MLPEFFVLAEPSGWRGEKNDFACTTMFPALLVEAPVTNSEFVLPLLIADRCAAFSKSPVLGSIWPSTAILPCPVPKLFSHDCLALPVARLKSCPSVCVPSTLNTPYSPDPVQSKPKPRPSVPEVSRSRRVQLLFGFAESKLRMIGFWLMLVTCSVPM